MAGRFCVALAAAMMTAAAQGAAVSETFGPSGKANSTHRGALTVTRSKAASVVAVDLSSVPAGAKVHHASLIALRHGKGLEDRQREWLRPVLVCPLPPGADEPGKEATPLEFEAPWYRSFDVTGPVRAALAAAVTAPAKGEAVKVRFLIKQFYRWRPEATELQVTWEGQPADVPRQVTGVTAVHAGGNTFITFNEVDKLVDKDEVTIGELVEARKKLAEAEKTRLVRYRILRHDEPITAANAAQATVLAEVAPLSCANRDGGLYHWGRKKEPQNRFVVPGREGKLPWGTGLYVHTTREKAGRFHYAVATVLNGRANLKDFSAANAPPKAVPERASPQPVPVLQADVNTDAKGSGFGGVRRNARVRLYVTWNAEPYANLPNMPYNWCVTIDEKSLADPAPLGLYLHEWGGTHVRTTWGWPGGRTGILVTGNDHPPQTWWYGWHESKWTSRSWGTGKVHNYTERRVLALLDWVATQWPVDPNRVFASGGSMGGSGIYTFALRHGDRFAMVSGNVGVANWTVRGHFTTSLETCTGYLNWNGPASDAATVATRVNMTQWLREHPAVETPFLAAGNGKNDGAIGWPQAHGFFKALQETRRPHAVYWGLYGHGTPAASMRIEGRRSQAFRLDQTLPAFTGCSLDDDIGTATKRDKPRKVKRRDGHEAADPYDGDPEGGFNLHLRWKTDEKLVVDRPEAWGLTVFLAEGCKAESCTVNVTPRRCRKFRAAPGKACAWTVADADGKEIQSGTAVADDHGLVTMKAVKVLKAGSRIRLGPKR